MKSFSHFLNESNGKTIIHKLGWPDADNWTGEKMSFNKKIKIAKQYSKRIGTGSARDVFEIDHDKFTAVMKIAKNVKGFRQNLAEINLYQKYKMKPPFIAPMIEFDDNQDADPAWILLHKALKFDKNIFWQFFGLTFKDFSNELSAVINKQKRKHPDNINLNKFLKFVDDNDLMLGEYRQQSNMMTYNGKPVIADAGLTRSNMSQAW